MTSCVWLNRPASRSAISSSRSGTVRWFRPNGKKLTTRESATASGLSAEIASTANGSYRECKSLRNSNLVRCYLLAKVPAHWPAVFTHSTIRAILVYVGKASRGTTKSKRTLRARLSEHAAKISQRRNITLDNMKCRYLTFSSEWWVFAAEFALITHYLPEWNESGEFPDLDRSQNDEDRTRLRVSYPPNVRVPLAVVFFLRPPMLLWPNIASSFACRNISAFCFGVNSETGYLAAMSSRSCLNLACAIFSE